MGNLAFQDVDLLLSDIQRSAPNRELCGVYPRHTQRYFRALTSASAGSLQVYAASFYGRVLGRGGPHAAEVVWIMSRVIAVTACGFMLAACSATMPSLSLDFMKSAPQPETLTIESQPPGAEAKTSLGQNCRTPCQFRVQPGSEFSVTLTLSGYQPQTVLVRPEADGAVAVPRLAPNPVHVDLQAVAPPKKPVPKKKKPAEATGGDAAGRAPSPPAETAPSATNYPWPAR